MADQKTKPTGEDVEQVLNGIADQRKRQDSLALLDLFRQVTKIEPKIWTGNMVGFGDWHYKYASGHEGDAFIVGFAPRKQNLALYVLTGSEREAQLLQKLGKYKTGKVCLYINHLEDVDVPTLRELIQQAWEHGQTNKM